MVNSTFTLEAPGDVNRLPKRYLETRGMLRGYPKRYPRKLDVKRPSNTYQLLLITANYYLLLLTITLSYALIHNDEKY